MEAANIITGMQLGVALLRLSNTNMADVKAGANSFAILGRFKEGGKVVDI